MAEGDGDRDVARAGVVIGGLLLAAIAAAAWLDWQWGRELFSHACHQRSDRCFAIGGSAMAVCARCLGIYSGIVIGCMARGFCPSGIRMKAGMAWLALSVAIAANGSDFWFEQMGLYADQRGLRYLLGLVLGIALAGIVFRRTKTAACRGFRGTNRLPEAVAAR